MTTMIENEIRPLKLDFGEVVVGLVDSSPTNPRRHFDEGEMAELVASVLRHGVMEPLLVRPTGGGRFEIVCGERRWRACREAGLETVPAIVRAMDDLEMAELQMVENIARSNLDPLEESYGVERLVSLGRTPDEVAETLHRGKDWVQLRLELGTLPEVARDAIRGRRMRLETAAQMLRLDAADREAAAQELMAFGEDMDPAAVREMLQARYFEPRARREQWRRAAAKVLAAMDGADGVEVLEDSELAFEHVRPWGDAVAPWVLAESRIGAAAARASEESVTWGDLARGHGFGLLLVPVGDVGAGKTAVVVNAKAVRDAEGAARDSGGSFTLGHRRGEAAPADPEVAGGCPVDGPEVDLLEIRWGHELLPMVEALLDVLVNGWRAECPCSVTWLAGYEPEGGAAADRRALLEALAGNFGARVDG
jgi:ParB/RepB/Spo0J family partition protein